MVNDYRIKRPDPKKDLAFEVAASLDDYIEFHEGEKTLLQTIAPATKGQRAIFSCYWYQYEVCNGGHGQFFENSTGILWDRAASGCELINAPRYGEILRDAISLFPKEGPSKDRDSRKKQLKMIAKEQLEKLDDRLYEQMRIEDFEEIMAKYILANPSEFFLG